MTKCLYKDENGFYHISLWYVPKKYQRKFALSSMVRPLMKEKTLTQNRCPLQNFKARYLMSLWHFAKKQRLYRGRHQSNVSLACAYPEKQSLSQISLAALLQSDERIPGVQVFNNYFGGCYCSFWYTWQIQAECHKNYYPLAANAVKIETLPDDLMPSVLTVEEAQETRVQLSGLRDQPEFNIHN